MNELRVGKLFFLAVAVALAILGSFSYRALGDLETRSGWSLFVAVAILGLYGARKRLSFLPLGRVSSWLDVHLGTGLLAIGIFCVHTGLRLPAGLFEQLLWLCFVTLAASGLIGWGIVRVGPRILPRQADDPLDSDIPERRNSLSQKARRLAAEIPRDKSTGPLTRLCREVVLPWLDSSPILLGAAARRRHAAILRQCQGLHRYLHEDSQQILLGFESVLEERRRIDVAWRRHRLLRGWLLVHGSLTGVLIVAVVVHVLLVRSHAAAGPG